jgi:HEPN domain-containing protein/predicted nucleotidyltransferase
MAIKPLVQSEEARPSWLSSTPKELLREVTRRVVETFQPEQIILFGSFAYGKPRSHSDVDLLVVTNRLRNKSVFERDRRVAEVARSSVGMDGFFPLDVIVRSPAELKYRLKIGDPFFREVMLKGKVLYARPGAPRRYNPKQWRNRMPEPVLVAEWVQRAEGDYQDALQIIRRRKSPNPNSVCYHCQQCAEKYLKAFLLQHNIHFERTHNLEDLNELCIHADNSFFFIADWLTPLNPYATETRYPGRHIEIEEAREAVAIIKKVRKFVRSRMGLK